jgi:hypothetical protein
MARDSKLYNLPAYLDASDLALARDKANTTKFIAQLSDPDSALRYWATAGLLMLGKADEPTCKALESVLGDPCGEIGALAAWVLLESGHQAQASAGLAKLLDKHSPATLLALNVLDWTRAEITPFLSAFDSIARDKGPDAEYEMRMINFLRESHGLPVLTNPLTPDGPRKKGNAGGAILHSAPGVAGVPLALNPLGLGTEQSQGELP